MKERPILFSGEMVRAILAGTKTQTRRVVKPEHIPTADINRRTPRFFGSCPYGQPGDRLWVRETFRVIDGQTQKGIAVDYRADPEEEWCRIGDFLGDGRKWTPSRHMRREYSRILLEITNVLVERVQDISEQDAIAEGITGPHHVGYPAYQVPGDSKPRFSNPVSAFEDLWDSINAARGYGWDVNPSVWVITFRRIGL